MPFVMNPLATPFVPGASAHLLAKPTDDQLTMLAIHMTYYDSARSIITQGLLKANPGACRGYPYAVYMQPMPNHSVPTSSAQPEMFATSYGKIGFVVRIPEDGSVATLDNKLEHIHEDGIVSSTEEVYHERSVDSEDDPYAVTIEKGVIAKKASAREVFARALEIRRSDTQRTTAPPARKPYCNGHSSNLMVPHDIKLDGKSPKLVCVFSCVALRAQTKRSASGFSTDVEYSVPKNEREVVEKLCREKNIPFFMDVHNERELTEKLVESGLF